MTQIPDSLPTLASGKHEKGAGQACVMEYVSILAGENFTDHPSCTDPILAAAARSVNDWLTDEGRGQLVPLIGRLFGTATRGSDEIGLKMAEFVKEYVYAEIAKNESVDADTRLIRYMTALLDEFDRLTDFTDMESTKLTTPQLSALSAAVEYAKQ